MGCCYTHRADVLLLGVALRACLVGRQSTTFHNEVVWRGRLVVRFTAGHTCYSWKQGRLVLYSPPGGCIVVCAPFRAFLLGKSTALLAGGGG